jgi:hypothetical protein
MSAKPRRTPSTPQPPATSSSVRHAFQRDRRWKDILHPMRRLGQFLRTLDNPWDDVSARVSRCRDDASSVSATGSAKGKSTALADSRHLARSNARGRLPDGDRCTQSGNASARPNRPTSDDALSPLRGTHHGGGRNFLAGKSAPVGSIPLRDIQLHFVEQAMATSSGQSMDGRRHARLARTESRKRSGAVPGGDTVAMHFACLTVTP